MTFGDITTSYVITMRGCTHCPFAKKAANFVNLRLPDDKQIVVKDNFEWEEFGLKGLSIMDSIPKDFEGYPYIYIDGIVIEPVDDVNLMIISIAKALEEDLIIPIQVGHVSIGY